MTDQEQLEQAIAALEIQRAALGDAVVDAALAPLREKLADLVDPHHEKQQRKLATVLFMDIVGSTAITRDLDPEDTMAIMDTALQRLAKPVYAYGGRVTRFMGDGFLALFGGWEARENEPEMGVRAGLQILAEAQVYAQEVNRQWQIPVFNVRVGVCTGLIIIGGESEAENTLMGSTVNLAARLESAADPGTLLISHHTYQHICDIFDVESQEPITAKGFSAPIPVYQVLRAKPRAFQMSTWSVAGIETEMIGRDPELLMLQNMFHDMTEDAEVHVVTVVGEAGVGKSRLLHEFETWIEGQPACVQFLRGRATLETETTPYGLIRRTLAQRFDILESDNAAEARDKFRSGMAPALHANQADLVGQLLGFDFSTSQVVQDQLGRESFGEAAADHFVKYVHVLAAEPTVIFLEDIHWADDSSLDLLNHLLGAASDMRLLAVCLARPALFERRPAWGEGQAFHTRINLKPLSRRASRALVGEILQKVELIPKKLRDLIVEGAEGNPFYIEELVKILIEDGVIVHDTDNWQVEIDRLESVHVPPTLTGVLQARLDCLPPREKLVLQRASVVGRLFWDEIVAELASDNIEYAQVARLLDDARNRELIFRREYSTFDATDEYIFKHALLHDVTYETVLLKLRRVYHAQVAKWLESAAGDRINEYLSLIARHYELAGETEKAVDFLQRSGEESLQVGAFREAIRAFERVLALVPEVDSDQDFRPSIPLLDRDLAERAMLLINLGNSYNRMGKYQIAEQHLQQGLALARRSNDSQALIAALNRLAQVASEQGTYDIAQHHLDEVLALAREQDDRSCVASTLSMLGSIAWKWGNLEQAEKCSLESLEIYEELKDWEMIPKTHNILGILAVVQENYVQADKHFQQALKMAREKEIDDPVMLTNLLNNLGYINHHHTKNYAKANGYYNEALQIAREIDHRSGVTSTLNNLGLLHILLGEHQTALRYLRESLTESVEIGAVPLTLEALVGVAQHQIETDQPISAAELLGLVKSHPALELDVSQVAESILERVRDVLPCDDLSAALERGKAMELDRVIADLQTMMAEMLDD